MPVYNYEIAIFIYIYTYIAIKCVCMYIYISIYISINSYVLGGKKMLKVLPGNYQCVRNPTP